MAANLVMETAMAICTELWQWHAVPAAEPADRIRARGRDFCEAESYAPADARIRRRCQRAATNVSHEGSARNLKRQRSSKHRLPSQSLPTLSAKHRKSKSRPLV